jgi:ribosomal protein S18 acetylase RimI-like enzyme
MTNDDYSTMHVGDHSLTVREITTDDIERLGRMFTRLSPDSVYRRFFSPIQKPSHTALLWLTSVDHGTRDAIVALDGDEIVAVARYDGRTGQNTAEIAVTVEDAWQHLGVGQRLTKRLARRAIDHGIESFELVVQPDNRAALRLLRKLSPDASVRFDRGEYAASVPLPH